MGNHLFRQAATGGVYYLPKSRLKAVERAAESERLHVLPIEIAPQSSKDQALAEIGSALDFPIWYGANFDALFDCLTDPDWQPAKGHVILIKGISELRTTDPEDFATLIEVFQAAADTRRESGALFWVLLDTPARGIPTLPEA